VTAKASEVVARPRVLALEWLDPLFAAGHWVPEMIRLAGGRDILGVEGRPSAQIAWPRTIEGDPEVIVLMPCGFTLEQTVHESVQLQFVEDWVWRISGGAPKVYAVNGSAYFNRPGPRIVDGLAPGSTSGWPRSWPAICRRRRSFAASPLKSSA